MASVGKHIRRLRTARGLTQEQLAEKLFVTRQAVSAWETEKAMPDLPMLEKIAAALECEVTEVIYGVPAGGADIRRQRKKWLAVGAAIAVALSFTVSVIIGALSYCGYFGTKKYGLPYQYWDQKYAVSIEELPGSWSMQLDLTDPDSNRGKVLYEDDAGCRITVSNVSVPHTEEYDGRRVTQPYYWVEFTAEGFCTPSGGQLVSGCQNFRQDKQAYTVHSTASMTTTLGDVLYDGCRDYVSSSMGTTYNIFGFHLFPSELFKEGAEGASGIAAKLDDADGIVTVTVNGLTRLTTTWTGNILR